MNFLVCLFVCKIYINIIKKKKLIKSYWYFDYKMNKITFKMYICKYTYIYMYIILVCKILIKTQWNYIIMMNQYQSKSDVILQKYKKKSEKNVIKFCLLKNLFQFKTLNLN